MNEQYADKLYKALSQQKWVTVSQDEFNNALKDSAYVDKLYKALSDKKWVTVSRDEFASSLGGGSMGKLKALKRAWLKKLLQWIISKCNNLLQKL